MNAVGQRRDPLRVTGVKPGFNHHGEDGVSAFEDMTERSIAGKWKVIPFYPKDCTFVCPTEIAGLAKLAQDFEERDAVLLAGSAEMSLSSVAGAATTGTSIA
jgi:peroxiredoxin (alkyl hydroperoxide reductase subunit C)